MASLNNEQLRRLARLGAVARLDELRAEEAAIRAEFPEIFGRGRRGAAAGAPVARKRKRKPMTPAQKKAVSDRMRKYWADRRKKG